MSGEIGGTGPVHLRWRPAGAGPAPVTETFDTLDAALDAVEARWEEIRAGAPQILDARRVLLVSTGDLERMMAAEEDEAEGTSAGPAA
jgi:hypothetical protein